MSNEETQGTGIQSISILHHTRENSGDNVVAVTRAYESRPGETVENLVTRILGTNPLFGHSDRIEIRRLVPFEPADEPHPRIDLTRTPF